MKPDEIWKDIKGYEGLYQISSLSRIKSIPRKYSKKQEIILKQQHDKDGYSIVRLSKNGISTNKKVHRLMAETFISNINNLPQVNHIDGNKQNNNINNLEWCTNKENIHHSWSIGLQKKKLGKENHKSVKINQYDKDMKLLKEWDCSSDIERQLKIFSTSIIACCKEKRKTAGGYVWKYATSKEG